MYLVDSFGRICVKCHSPLGHIFHFPNCALINMKNSRPLPQHRGPEWDPPLREWPHRSNNASAKMKPLNPDPRRKSGFRSVSTETLSKH